VTNFGAIGSAYENITGGFASFTAIDNAPVTIEVWFKPDFAGSGEQILVETGGSGTGTSLSYDNSTGFVTFRIDGGNEADPNTQLVLSATGITPNEFNHLVGVYYRDEFGTVDTLTLYVNNNPTSYNGTPNADSYPGDQPTGVNDITGGNGSGIGTVGEGSLAQGRENEPQITDFQGQIAIMRIYGRALSAAEIEENFDVVVQPITGVAPDLVTAPTSSTVTSTLGATVTLKADGSFDYDASSLNTDIPEGDKVNDSFVYSIDDGEGGVTKATVTVTVTGVGNFLAQADNTTVSAAGPALSIDVTTNDTGFAGTTQLEIEAQVATLLGDIADTSGFSHGDAADFRDGSGYGWQLLWNAPVGWTADTTAGWSGTTGPLGTAADYDQLVWDTTVNGFLVDADGVTSNAEAEPGAYLRLTQAGLAHTSLGSAQDGGLTPPNDKERCLIFAYTVSEDGLYAITNSTITTNTAGNGVTIETYVQDTFQGSVVVPQNTTDGDFDQKLTTSLLQGETIYVAVCPNTSRASDTVPNIDFDIVKIPAADAELLDILGTITVVGNQIVYDPNGQFDKLKAGESVFETFTYTIIDGSDVSTATVTVEVIGVNDDPVAVDDNGGSTDDNTVLNGATVLANDTDVDLGEGGLNLIADMVRGDGAAVAVPGMITTAKGANVTMAADGTFTYDPTTSSALNSLGFGDADTTDSFFYSVRDVNGAVSGEAVVSLTITPADDGVFANADAYTLDPDFVLSGNVLTDDTGSGADVSVDANDLLAVSGKNEAGLSGDGVLGLEAGATVGARGTVSATNTVQTVSFGTTFATVPVVIAGPPTFNDAEPTVARVTNVTTSGFDLELYEMPETLTNGTVDTTAAASDLDGATHAAESVDWVALEKGQYQLANGALMEVGSLDTQATAGTFAAVTFATTFGSAPVVINHLQTQNDTTVSDRQFGTRCMNITASGFEVALENVQAAPATPARTVNETIGWIAISDNQTG
ncbi:MAG: hypothetical protein HKO57_13900, partial [Akkermansiaceae bacterium]|nr:hypothetical protein [Akkermansiaceae bacterium]